MIRKLAEFVREKTKVAADKDTGYDRGQLDKNLFPDEKSIRQPQIVWRHQTQSEKAIYWLNVYIRWPEV